MDHEDYTFTCQHKRDRFSLQVTHKSGESVVVISPHAWKRNSVFLAGSAEVGLGIYALAAATVTPLFLTCAGAGILASGIESLYYAIKTPEERVNPTDFMKRSVISFIGGAVSGGMGRAAAPFTPPAANLAIAALSNMTGSVASATAEAAIKRDVKVLEKLTPAHMAETIFVGLVTGGSSNLTKDVIEQAEKGLLQQVNACLADIFLKLSLESSEEAMSHAIVKIKENSIKILHYLKSYQSRPFS